MGNCFNTKQNLAANELDNTKPNRLPKPADTKENVFESEFEGKSLFDLTGPKFLDQIFEKVEIEIDESLASGEVHAGALGAFGFAWKLYLSKRVEKGGEQSNLVTLETDSFFTERFVALNWMNLGLAENKALYPKTEEFSVEDSEFTPNGSIILRVELVNGANFGSLKLKSYRRQENGEIQIFALPLNATDISKLAKYEKLCEEHQDANKMKLGGMRLGEKGKIYMYMSVKGDSKQAPEIAQNTYRLMGESFMTTWSNLMFDFAFRNEKAEGLKWFTDDKTEIEGIMQEQRERINEAVVAGGKGFSVEQLKTVWKVFPATEECEIEVEFEVEEALVGAQPEMIEEEQELEQECEVGDFSKKVATKAVEEIKSEEEEEMNEEIVVVAQRDLTDEEQEEPEEENVIGGQQKVPVRLLTVEIEKEVVETVKGETVEVEKEETDDEEEEVKGGQDKVEVVEAKEEEVKAEVSEEVTEEVKAEASPEKVSEPVEETPEVEEDTQVEEANEEPKKEEKEVESVVETEPKKEGPKSEEAEVPEKEVDTDKTETSSS